MFEGTEKKLELILDKPLAGLRDGRLNCWNAVVKACGAEIINRMATPVVDAYLLSESSLFVWDSRILMITCGQTTLVDSLGPILAQVGAANVAAVFYERQNMIEPGRQPRSFAEDRRHLRRFFQGQDVRLGSADGDHVDVFYKVLKPAPSGPDVTLQILMHDLDMDAETVFAAVPVDACRAPAIDRITSLFSGMQLDQHFFAPCGYSLNGVAGGHYGTVHVTPQQGGSYASFETDCPGGDTGGILHTLTEVFRPGRFGTLVTTRTDAARGALQATPPWAVNPQYHLADHMRAEFENVYAVTCSNYVRTTSV